MEKYTEIGMIGIPRDNHQRVVFAAVNGAWVVISGMTKVDVHPPLCRLKWFILKHQNREEVSCLHGRL